VAYLLLADDHTCRCRTWNQLAERLLWAHRQGFTSAKARHTAWEEDRPLLPSEAAALIETATELALSPLTDLPARAGGTRASAQLPPARRRVPGWRA
jgi:hypothetical protein